MRLILVFLTLILCLSGTELLLRVYFPRYKLAADTSMQKDYYRLFRRIPFEKKTYFHPDKKTEHTVSYNKLGLRQSSEFELKSTKKTLGFFGDSFLENLRLPTPFILTELLSKALPQFNVLNFGIEGYGIDQSYLFWKASPVKVDHVFYLFIENDLRDIFQSKLFSLDSKGNLALSIQEPSMLKQFLGKFYLTYFFIESYYLVLRKMEKHSEYRGVLDSKTSYFKKDVLEKRLERIEDRMAIRIPEDKKEATVAIFKKILAKWKEEVLKSGASFSVIIGPSLIDLKRSKALIDSSYNILYLSKKGNKDHFFKNDGHWNELGNKVAAEAITKWIKSDKAF